MVKLISIYEDVLLGYYANGENISRKFDIYLSMKSLPPVMSGENLSSSDVWPIEWSGWMGTVKQILRYIFKGISKGAYKMVTVTKMIKNKKKIFVSIL